MKPGIHPMNSVMPQLRSSFLSAAVLILVFVSTACRSYLGSSSLHEAEWSYPTILKQETDVDRRQGIIFSANDTAFAIRFAEKSWNKEIRQTILSERYGRKYYYYDASVGDRILYLFLWPLSTLFDLFCCSDAESEYMGDRPPGLFYRVAYLPVVRLFFQPILLSPSGVMYDRKSYEEKQKRLESEYSWEGWKDTRKKIEQIYSPVFRPDRSGTVVTVTTGKRQIRKTLSADGTMSFALSDFGDMEFDPAENITFRIWHPTWKKTWTVDVPPLISEAAIRDWNIYSDSRYDYWTRAEAMSRLEPFIGEASCQKYLEVLLNGKSGQSGMPSMSREIRIDLQP